MPYVKNPDGVVVCVPDDMVQELLAQAPVRHKINGRLKASTGFTLATDEDIAALKKYVKETQSAYEAEENRKRVTGREMGQTLLEGMRAMLDSDPNKGRKNAVHDK